MAHTAQVLQAGEVPGAVLRALGASAAQVIDVAGLQAELRRRAVLADLARLRAVDASIALARRATAALEEDTALSALARAERMLWQSFALAGASQFYAELQLQLGVSAAQSGLYELADAAFARAASVDPSRRLLAGEAAPEVVSLASRAYERVSAAPEGAVQIVISVDGASVFVDDSAVGRAPLSLHLRSGPHVLRVQAPGYVTYARLFEMFAGDRPALHVALSPEPALAPARELESARVHGAAKSLERASGRLFELAPALARIVVGERAARHGWIASCDRGACALRTYAIGDSGEVVLGESVRLSSATLLSARAWLTPGRSVATATITSPSGLWHRWYVWAAAGALLVGAGLWVGVATQPDPEHRLRVSVDPSALR